MGDGRNEILQGTHSLYATTFFQRATGDGKLLEDDGYGTRDLEHHHELVVFPARETEGRSVRQWTVVIGIFKHIEPRFDAADRVRSA